MATSLGEDVVYEEPPAVEHVRKMAAKALNCKDADFTEGFGLTFLQLGAAAFLICSVFLFTRAAASPYSRRHFFWPLIFATFSTGAAYFAMSQDQGWALSHGCRQLFVARFADWSIAHSCIVVALGFIAGADTSDVASGVGFSLLTTVAFGAGALSWSPLARWLWFFLGLIFLGLMLFVLLVVFKETASSKTAELEALYSNLSIMVVACMAVYALVWLFSQGFHSFSLTFEISLHLALDFITRIFVSAQVVLASSLLDYCNPT